MRRGVGFISDPTSFTTWRETGIVGSSEGRWLFNSVPHSNLSVPLPSKPMNTVFASSPAPSFPPLNDLLSALSRVDWRRRFIQLVLLAATIAAVTVAVVTFAVKHARAFWAAYGETIHFHFDLFIEQLVAFIQKVYDAGTASRPVVTRWLNWLLDRAFYLLAD